MRKPSDDGPSCTSSGGDEIRQRVMREAEEAFAREVRRLQGPTEETQSYQSASSGAGVGVGIGQTMGVPQPMGGGRNRPPRGMGGMPSPPPGIAVPAQAGSALTEALRTLELPKLPAPGGEGASLQFGDWLTVVYPLMSDVSGSASEWWGSMAQAVGEPLFAVVDCQHHLCTWKRIHDWNSEQSQCSWVRCRSP